MKLFLQMKLVQIHVDYGMLLLIKNSIKIDLEKILGDLIPAYSEVAKRLGILHEQSNVSAVNVTKLSSIKKKSK